MSENRETTSRDQRDDGVIGTELSPSDQQLMDQMRDADADWAGASDEEHTRALSDARQRRIDHDATPPSTAPAEPAPDDPEVVRRERDQYKQNFLTLEERSNRLFAHLQQQEALRQQQAAQRAVPDPQTDPVGAILHELGTHRQILAQNYQQQQYAQVQQQAYTALSGLTQDVGKAEADYRQSRPDYDDAINFLREGLDRELEKVRGITDPAVRQQIIMDETAAAAIRCKMSGQNLAAAAYQLAELRGFRPGRGSPSQRIQTIASGHQQSRSLGNVRGAGPKAMSYQTLLDASYDDFEKLIATPEGRDLLGA